MTIQIIPYSPLLHEPLLRYMQLVYPHRSKEFLNWWISKIDSSGDACWDKCRVITSDDNVIIGCTTAIESKLMVGEDIKTFFFRGNTIVSPEQRGKGISKGLYEFINGYNNWLSVGITDIAWKIQPKYVKNFTPIQPLRIYANVNFKVVLQLLKKLFRYQDNTKKGFVMPNQIDINKKNSFVKAHNVNELGVPLNGCWTDEVELVRDKDYLNKRFFDIYCAQRYGVYNYEKDGKSAGYVVLRKTRYAGFDMVVVVDYRFMDKKDERLSFAMAKKLARKNNLGFAFGMSSRRYSFFGWPLLIRSRKVLNCATGSRDVDFSDMLVTSADADLDFVYYKK